MKTTRRSIEKLAVLAIVALVALAGCGSPAASPTPAKPAVAILAPANGSQVTANQPVTIQVQAMDSQGVARLEVQVDGVVISTAEGQGQPSLGIAPAWTFAHAGSHVVMARAFNTAGLASDPAVISVLVVAESADLVPAAALTAPPEAPTVPPEAAAEAPTLTPTEPAATDTPGGESEPAVQVQAAKPAVQFAASPASIAAGASSTLSWEVRGATQVTLSSSEGSSQVEAQGSRTVSLDATTTFKLTAVGPGGSTVKEVTVQVQAAKPAVQFAASPASITAGASSTLSWEVRNATQVTLSSSEGSSQVEAQGSRTVTLDATTTFKLTAVGPGGSTVKEVTVQVQAAPQSAWSAWAKLGGKFTAAPAVASWNDNRLDVFVRGTNTHLMHRTWKNNTWEGWEDLQGELADSPACVSWGAKRIDCFIRGKNDNELWHRAYTGSQWEAWEKLGGAFTFAPTVASWGANRLDVFVRGTNAHLMHRWWSGSWSNWEDLGGELADAPACVSWGTNRIDCFIRKQSDQELWHRAWNGTKWEAWDKVGGSFPFAPTIASWAPNRLDVFVRGHNAHLMHRWWNGSWSNWEDLGGELAQTPACISRAADRIDCLIRGKNDDELWHRAWGIQ